MNPKETPFADAYVKEQQSTLSLGYKLFAVLGIMVLVVGLIVLVSRSVDSLVLGIIFITLANIYLVWASLAKQRLNTFRENLELSKLIQQLREDK
jgi:Flp pilus assembly protein TadB